MSIRRSLAWTFSQQILSLGMQFGSSIIVARLLRPDEIGVFSLAMAANAFVSTFRSFGVGSYLIREPELNDDKVRTAFGLFLTLSWSLGLLLLVSRNLIAGLYDAGGIADVLAVISISFFVTPIGQPAQSLLMRNMRFDILHHITLISNLVGAVTSVVLAYMGFSYMALAWGMLATACVRSCCLIAVRRDHLRLRPGFVYWREVLSFGGYLTGASFMSTLSTNGIVFLIGALISTSAVAIYERAVQLPGMLRGRLLGPFSAVMVPAFSQNIREGKSIGSAVLKLIDVQTSMVWPAFLTIGLLAQPIIVFLFGENWRMAGVIMPFILIAHIMRTVHPNADEILIPHGEVRRLLVLRIVTVSANIGISAVACYLGGLMGFAASRIITEFIMAISRYIAIRPYWHVTASDLRPVYLRGLFITAISVIPAVVVSQFWVGEIGFVPLLAVALTAPFFWALSVWLSKPLIFEEITNLLSHALAIVRPRRAPRGNNGS